jgi:hypothetical protein
VTLVMSLISRDHAIQVSDRRFVIHELDGSRGFEDFENKSVIGVTAWLSPTPASGTAACSTRPMSGSPNQRAAIRGR